MKQVRKTLSILDSIYHRCINSGAALAGVLIVFIMLITTAEVLMRKFLLMPIKGVVELTEYLMIWITFLGAAWVLKKEGHVKIDVLLSRLKPRGQAFLNVVSTSIMAAICLFLTIFGGIVTYDSVIRGAARVYQYTVPLWILLIIIPISGFLLFIQSVKRARGYWQLTRKESGHE
jgi:TRAP-type C4-dicarboxylate transport system permease small subunit